MELTIKKIGINGEGIGYDNKVPVFVMGAFIDEVIECNVTENKGRYKIAELVKVKKSSPDRIPSVCRIQKDCGGCPLLTLNYAKQLEAKEELLKESLKKYANGLQNLVEEIVPSEQILGYRNQCKLPVKFVFGRLQTGMYQAKSNRFIPMEVCKIHDPLLDSTRTQIINLLSERKYHDYDEKTRRGIRNLVLRVADGKIQCTIVTGSDDIDEGTVKQICAMPNMSSVWQNINLSRNFVNLFSDQWKHLGLNKSLMIKEEGLNLKLSAASFFQLNTKQAFKLYSIAKDLVPECDLLVEAYCGVGTMSLMMADRAKEVIGIEIIGAAIKNANENARLNKIDNVKFVCGDAAEETTKISKKRKIDCLLIDPPRTGIDDAMLDCIMKSKIKNIVYISCNPATLAKDLNELSNRYTVDRIIPVDMFPNTPLVESVVLLNRK